MSTFVAYKSINLLHSVTAEEGPRGRNILFCLLIYMPRKVLINPSKLISQCGNEPLQHSGCYILYVVAYVAVRQQNGEFGVC